MSEMRRITATVTLQDEDVRLLEVLAARTFGRGILPLSDEDLQRWVKLAVRSAIDGHFDHLLEMPDEVAEYIEFGGRRPLMFSRYERERGEDDGREYGHPGDYLRGLD